MDEKESQKVEKLAEEHWQWIERLLVKQMTVTERLFKDAFRHGWKHAKEGG